MIKLIFFIYLILNQTIFIDKFRTIPGLFFAIKNLFTGMKLDKGKGLQYTLLTHTG